MRSRTRRTLAAGVALSLASLLPRRARRTVEPTRRPAAVAPSATHRPPQHAGHRLHDPVHHPTPASYIKLAGTPPSAASGPSARTTREHPDRRSAGRPQLRPPHRLYRANRTPAPGLPAPLNADRRIPT